VSGNRGEGEWKKRREQSRRTTKPSSTLRPPFLLLSFSFTCLPSPLTCDSNEMKERERERWIERKRERGGSESVSEGN
jgi:hypothetical protein